MPAKKKTASRSSSDSGSGKPKASELIKRNRQQTPAIFKVSGRRHAPIVFSLEDVREILKKKQKEAAKEPKKEPAKKAAAPAAEKPAPAPEPEAPAAKSRHAAASLADILGFGVGPAQPAATPAKPKDAIAKKDQLYYNLLLELRTHVRESLGMHAEDTLKRSQKEDSGDISTSADAGTDNFDRDFALSVVSSEQEALREIEAAIKRIHNGTYGVCEITGEPIAPERLEAVPFTRFSLEGQRQYESTARRRVQRGGGSFMGEGGGEVISFGDDDGDN